MNAELSKSELRKEAQRRRSQLSEQERTKKSALIVKRVELDPDWQRAKVVCVYVWFKSEVQTDALIESAWLAGKTVCVPLCGATDKDKITLYKIRSFDDLAPGAFGIQEPKVGQAGVHLECIALADVDAFIVPGIAFDKQGNRLGWGGGFYDWALSRAVNAKKIALAFSCQIFETIPVEPQDIKMDKIICEANMIVPVTD